MKKLKTCYHCGSAYSNRSNYKIHLMMEHGLKPRGPRHRTHVGPGIPNVVHFGARMRKKLGLEYSPTGHLRSTLEAA